MQMELKQLSDEQLSEFDTDDMFVERWRLITQCIDRDFPDGKFSFLDLGGGNGIFTDRLLYRHPEARAVVLDNSELLIRRNKPNPRKTILLASVEDMETKLAGRQFDIVFMNWLLHHLVADSYAQTRENVRSAVGLAQRHLTPKGRVSVFENLCDGILLDGLPSHLIFHISSSRWLAPLTKRLGANTAGVGVCYRSERQWLALFGSVGLNAVSSQAEKEPWYIPTFKKVLLHVLHIHDLKANLFWLKAG